MTTTDTLATTATPQTTQTPTETAEQVPSQIQAQTRERLLEAAGLVFAEQGFRRATVRQICDRAKANVAAVNYHFGDKMGLYSAVIKHGLVLALEKYPPEMDLPPGATPTERLHVFVRSYLYRLLGEGAPAWHGRLMAQEMIEPTEVMDALLATTIRPLSQKLESIVRDLLGPGADDETARACTWSIAGQCCFYRHAEAMLARLYPQQARDHAYIERLADHITRFSLEGLKCYAGECAGRVEGTLNSAP